jgi:hypothetical protein
MVCWKAARVEPSLSTVLAYARDGDLLMNFVLRPSLFGFVVATRAALAFGVGLLVANRIPEPRRRAIALTLIGVGAATTIPAIRAVLSTRTDVPALPKPV